jgi:cob(I)alamin adenosyltransferase
MAKSNSNKNILFTGKGDDGKTTLYHCDQGRISKSANIIEALGLLDELNAFLGIVKVDSLTNDFNLKIKNKNILNSNILNKVQQDLFVVQAELAGSLMYISKVSMNRVESIIDFVSSNLPPINSFTVSGGSLLSAKLDFARTLARKAERGVIRVQEEGFKKMHKNTLSYLNRLSSLLFALSRYNNYLLSIKEEHPNYNKK